MNLTELLALMAAMLKAGDCAGEFPIETSAEYAKEARDLYRAASKEAATANE